MGQTIDIHPVYTSNTPVQVLYAGPLSPKKVQPRPFINKTFSKFDHKTLLKEMSGKLRNRSSAVIFLVLAVTLLFQSRAAESEQTCKHEIPKGKNLTCTVSSSELLSRWDCEHENYASIVSEFHAYMGLTVTIICVDSVDVDAGQKVGIYKGGKIVDASSSHIFSNLQEEDVGEYECRIVFDNGTLVASTHYNITASAGMYLSKSHRGYLGKC